MSAKWKLWIDDTGAAGVGTYLRCEAAISSNQAITRKTIVHPTCENDSYEVEEPETLQLAVNAQIKVKRDSAIDQRLNAVALSGAQIGVMTATGDVTATTPDDEGFMLMEMNALVKSMPITQQTGSTIVYDVSFVPHADNADTALPRIAYT